MHFRSFPLTALWACIFLTAALVGCQEQQAGLKHLLHSVLPTTQSTQQDLNPMAYPRQADIAEAWDIELERIDRRQVRIDNRTTRNLAEVTFFFNQQYGGVIEELPVGKPVTINLQNFVNEHGERFPVGSLLEPEKSRVIVLADALVDGKLHKLKVRLDKDWQTSGRGGVN